jgi:hypothetical protein
LKIETYLNRSQTLLRQVVGLPKSPIAPEYLFLLQVKCNSSNASIISTVILSKP